MNTEIIVKGCADCIFSIMDVDYDSMGSPYMTYCQYLRMNENYNNSYIGSGEEPEQCFEDFLEGKLTDCPLRGSRITVTL